MYRVRFKEGKYRIIHSGYQNFRVSHCFDMDKGIPVFVAESSNHIDFRENPRIMNGQPEITLQRIEFNIDDLKKVEQYLGRLIGNGLIYTIFMEKEALRRQAGFSSCEFSLSHIDVDYSYARELLNLPPTN